MTNWLVVVLIVLLGIFILGLCSNISVFYTNSTEYENAYCRWDNFRKSMEVEGFAIELLKISLQDNRYEFYYTMKKKTN